LIAKLKGAGIESIFDLALYQPNKLIEDGGIIKGFRVSLNDDIEPTYEYKKHV
jgi:hypothetical protein